MSFVNAYIEKQKNFSVKIQEQVSSGTKYLVVIPCYNEQGLIDTYLSIKEAQKPDSSVEVITVINSSEITPNEILDQNCKTYKEASKWISENEESSLRFFLLTETNLPKKFAGAGLARKIGMDQAVARFNQTNREDGVIISLDADALIEPNYFIELEKYFKKYPRTNAITCYFEHPIWGDEFSEDIYSAISTYELYLRYYKQALNYTGFPYSFYTIGSCFAVSAKAYIKQGGMNRKQAGEDFYFLHKIFPLGNCYELNSTCVYPSSRVSDRVPFGTGPMIKSIIESENKSFLTYSLETFKELKIFFSCVSKLYKVNIAGLEDLLNELPECVQEFLIQSNIRDTVVEINANCSTENSFRKRFYSWFDAFKVLKFLNFAHEDYFEKQELLTQAEKFLIETGIEKPLHKNYKTYLETFRRLEKSY